MIYKLTRCSSSCYSCHPFRFHGTNSIIFLTKIHSGIILVLALTRWSEASLPEEVTSPSKHTNAKGDPQNVKTKFKLISCLCFMLCSLSLILSVEDDGEYKTKKFEKSPNARRCGNLVTVFLLSIRSCHTKGKKEIDINKDDYRLPVIKLIYFN